MKKILDLITAKMEQALDTDSIVAAMDELDF